MKRLAYQVLRLVRDGYTYDEALNTICRYHCIEPYDVVKLDREYQNLFDYGV